MRILQVDFGLPVQDLTARPAWAGFTLYQTNKTSPVKFWKKPSLAKGSSRSSTGVQKDAMVCGSSASVFVGERTSNKLILA